MAQSYAYTCFSGKGTVRNRVLNTCSFGHASGEGSHLKAISIPQTQFLPCESEMSSAPDETVWQSKKQQPLVLLCNR